MEVSGRKDSDLKTKLVCQPCQSDGDNVSAEGYCETCNEYFCSACLKFHRKQSATKNHVIKSKHDMPRGHVQADSCSEPCAVHKTEIVKFYCKLHDEVGCGDCMILEHKACKVQLVPDVSGNYGNSEELRQIIRTIERLRREINARKFDVEYNLKAAAKINRKVVEDIRKFRKDINTYLDIVEGKLIKEAEQLLSNDVSLQSKLQEECDSMQREIKQFQSEINKNTEKINKLFVTAKLAQKRLHEFQQSAERIASESQINSYNFQASKDLVTLKAANSVLGTLSMQSKKPIKKGKKNMTDMKTQFVKNLNIKASNEGTCWITGLAVISCDEILLADLNNESLKILNVRENMISSRYSCEPPTYPFDVTMINAETAAATFPDKGEIIFMNTTNGLTKIHSLKVRKKCRGIDHRNDHIAVSFFSPPAVQILNMEGEILNEVKDTNIFSLPSYIAFSRDTKSIYVTDNGTNEVYELSIDGKVKESLKCGKDTHPRGLVVTDDGTVVVCCERAYNRVSMIVPSTSEMRPLNVKYVQNPCAILLCEEQNKMFICSEASDSIKMFDLK